MRVLILAVTVIGVWRASSSATTVKLSVPTKPSFGMKAKYEPDW